MNLSESVILKVTHEEIIIKLSSTIAAIFNAAAISQVIIFDINNGFPMRPLVSRPTVT